jgi:hypothetical protein
VVKRFESRGRIDRPARRAAQAQTRGRPEAGERSEAGRGGAGAAKHINAQRLLPSALGKYDVPRQIEDKPAGSTRIVPALPEAA